MLLWIFQIYFKTYLKYNNTTNLSYLSETNFIKERSTRNDFIFMTHTATMPREEKALPTVAEQMNEAESSSLSIRANTFNHLLKQTSVFNIQC